MATAPAQTAATTPAEEATRLLYERYARRLFAFALRRLGTREEAEDAVQTTFLYVFRSLQRGVAPRHELAWLLKIAENVCRARRRAAYRRGGRETPVDPVAFEAVSARAGSADELFSLPEALAGMPPAQRRAILLREWRGLSYDEIGAELGVSQSAVEALLFRARRSLATRLERALKSLLGPLGFLRALLGGGAAKVAVTVAVVAGTSFVAVPSQPGMAHGDARPAAPSPTSSAAAGRTDRAAPASSLVRQPRAEARAARRAVRREPAAQAVVATPRSAPAPAGTASAPPDVQPGGEVDRTPAPTTDAGGTATTPAGTVQTTISGGSDSQPGATVEAGASTPVGTVEATATVDPQSSDPVTAEVTAPPLPQPPPLPEATSAGTDAAAAATTTAGSVPPLP